MMAKAQPHAKHIRVTGQMHEEIGRILQLHPKHTALEVQVELGRRLNEPVPAKSTIAKVMAGMGYGRKFKGPTIKSADLKPTLRSAFTTAPPAAHPQRSLFPVKETLDVGTIRRPGTATQTLAEEYGLEAPRRNDAVREEVKFLLQEIERHGRIVKGIVATLGAI